MPVKKSIWFRIGYAMERARLSPARGERSARSARKRAKSRAILPRARTLTPIQRSQRIFDTVFALGAGTVATRVLRYWPTRRRATLLGLFRAAASGAAASVLLRLLQPVLAHEEAAAPLDQELTDLLLSGVGRGLVYGALIEPRVPGPSILQGATYGSLEYVVAPWGGLEAILRRESPHGRVPVLSYLFRAENPAEMQFLDHLVFGVTLALLYRP